MSLCRTDEYEQQAHADLMSTTWQQDDYKDSLCELGLRIYDKLHQRPCRAELVLDLQAGSGLFAACFAALNREATVVANNYKWRDDSEIDGVKKVRGRRLQGPLDEHDFDPFDLVRLAGNPWAVPTDFFTDVFRVLRKGGSFEWQFIDYCSQANSVPWQEWEGMRQAVAAGRPFQRIFSAKDLWAIYQALWDAGFGAINCQSRFITSEEASSVIDGCMPVLEEVLGTQPAYIHAMQMRQELPPMKFFWLSALRPDNSVAGQGGS